jgi:glycosyltransferase involved in cell wall biosynthesis
MSTSWGQANYSDDHSSATERSPWRGGMSIKIGEGDHLPPREEKPETKSRAYKCQKLSIIIPVYNEQSTIKEVIDQVVKVDLNPIQKEIIIYDDGSTDASLEIIKHEQLAHSDIVKVYASTTNLGKGAAIRFGFRHATGDVIIIQDADLELNPREYADLIRPILNGQTNVVYGSRFKDKNKSVPLKTRLANRILTSLTNLLYGSHLTDMETAYKVFRADVIKTLQLRCAGFDIEPEITARLLRAGHSIYEVPVAYDPRTSQEGKKISWRDGIEAIYTLAKCRFT